MTKRPNHRYHAVKRAIKATTPPVDPEELALYNVILQKTTDRTDVSDAYDLYLETEHQAAVEAFLLAGATPSIIHNTLQIPVPVVEAYVKLFFDTIVFRNKLEALAYASNFEGSAHAAEVLRAAVTVGLEYLLWVYGSAEVQVDARQVIRQTMAESYYRGMAHRGNSLTSGVSKEAHRWWATAVKNAELLERIDPRAEKQAFEEIRIQLEKVDDTYSADAAPVDVSEILH